MKLNIRLHAGSDVRESLLELRQGESVQGKHGELSFVFSGRSGEADWSEISPGLYSILIGGHSYEVRVTRPPGQFPGGQAPYAVTLGNHHYLVEVWDARLRRRAAPTLPSEGPQEIVAPMPGKIVKILVGENQQVGSGEGLLVIEAMKMQNELRAPRPGRVEKIHIRVGTGVETGAALLRLV